MLKEILGVQLCMGAWYGFGGCGWNDVGIVATW